LTLYLHLSLTIHVKLPLVFPFGFCAFALHPLPSDHIMRAKFEEWVSEKRTSGHNLLNQSPPDWQLDEFME
jgi:hypothetical protein